MTFNSLVRRAKMGACGSGKWQVIHTHTQTPTHTNCCHRIATCSSLCSHFVYKSGTNMKIFRYVLVRHVCVCICVWVFDNVYLDFVANC